MAGVAVGPGSPYHHAVADRLGYPVVVKAVIPGQAHKGTAYQSSRRV